MPLVTSCNSSGQSVRFVDQEGIEQTGPIITIPDYGPHPEAEIVDGGAIRNASGQSSDVGPLVITQDPLTPSTWVLQWDATQQGRQLLARDGSVLYEAPDLAELTLNGAAVGTPVVQGGLRVTKTAAASFTVELAVSPTNPPSGWHVAASNYITDGPAP